MCSQGGSSSRRQRGPMTDGSGLKPLGLQSSFKPLPESSISSAFELFNKFNTAFVAFDLDGDGTITASELATATRSLGQQVSDDEMANLISQFDLNDNGASEAATPHPRHSSPPWQSSCLLTPGHRTTRPPNHLATEPPRDLTSRPLHLTT